MSTEFPANALRSLIAPNDWVNPVPKSRYSFVVIGGGAAGLVAAAGAAGLGASVALVERRSMGGDCLNHGCVPSKSLLASAHVLKIIADSHPMGFVSSPADIHQNFQGIIRRLEEAQLRIAPNDSVERFQKLGVDVFLGDARFVANQRIEVTPRKGDPLQLKFSKALIATGATPRIPLIPGLNGEHVHTSDSIFRLNRLPKHLLVLGGGPIGCEMAQAFVRLGAKVTLVEQAPSLLNREDADGAQIIAEQLQSEGVDLRLRSVVVECQKVSEEESHVRVERDGQQEKIVVDTVLVAIGKIANVSGLDLERAGVESNEKGVVVDDYLRTTNRSVYASGDVCSATMLTHSADFQSRLVLRNAFFSLGPLGRRKVSRLLIPRVVYTAPELAHVGLSEHDARVLGLQVNVFRKELRENDRSIIEREERGFFKVIVKKGSDAILGATIVSPYAGEHISQLTLAIQHGIGLGKIADTMFPYPTRSDLIRRIGDEYNRTRLTPLSSKILRALLKWNT